jgi:hypothetical protein
MMSQTSKHAPMTAAIPPAKMDEQQKFADLKTLARMAARLAGRDPDERLIVKVGEVVAFEDFAWRYPDFTKRAEAAYKLLESSNGFWSSVST